MNDVVDMRVLLILVLVLLFPMTASAQFDLDSAKKKCIDLGFKSGTEQFGKCVLQLSKVEEARKAPQQVSPPVQTSAPPQCVGNDSSWNDCIGTRALANGSKYEGEFRAGMYHGKGTLVSANGSKYSGEFRNGMFHGKGTLIIANGDRYVGEFKEFKFHGQGVYTWSNGQTYAGEFSDGWQHGQGTFTLPSGEKYAGQFSYDRRHGQGTYTHSDGSVLHSGMWANGNPVK